LGRSIGFRCVRPFELRGKEPPDPAYVSSSPSKIPYVGFSPVRLQTGLRPLRPSAAPRGLSDRPACARRLLPYTQPPTLHCTPMALAGMYAGPIVRVFQSRGPWLASRFCCPTGSSLTMASSAPLAPSRRFMDYAAGLRSAVCSELGSRGSPIYSACLFPSCRLPYPGGLSGCFWLLLHRPHWPSPSLHRFGSPHRHHRRFSGGQRHEAAKFTLCYGPKRLLALLRQGRLRSSFHLPSHLQEMSNITTRANQPIPAAGLSPARQAALWAASKARQGGKARQGRIPRI
jgi:hypothetical protein